MSKLRLVLDRTCRCDSGEFLNPLMHLFIVITLAFGIGLTFFAGTDTVKSTVIYQQTSSSDIGDPSIWGITCLSAAVFHLVGVAIRNFIGLRLMWVAMFLGFFSWLWATIIYLEGGYLFQFFAACVTNLLFWTWYAWQWWIRHQNPNNPEVSAFV